MKNFRQTFLSAALITTAVISSPQAQSSTSLLEIKKDDELNSVC